MLEYLTGDVDAPPRYITSLKGHFGFAILHGALAEQNHTIYEHWNSHFLCLRYSLCGEYLWLLCSDGKVVELYLDDDRPVVHRSFKVLGSSLKEWQEIEGISVGSSEQQYSTMLEYLTSEMGQSRPRYVQMVISLLSIYRLVWNNLMKRDRIEYTHSTSLLGLSISPDEDYIRLLARDGTVTELYLYFPSFVYQTLPIVGQSLKEWEVK